MDANNKSQTPLRDDELTPEQLKKRNKNRKQKKAKANGTNADSMKPNNTFTTAQNPVITPDSAPAKKEKLSDEEYFRQQEEFTQQQIEKKSSRIERNPKGSVVSTAETSESRGLAFKIDEINLITEHTRSNMGTERLSFEDGALLLKFFKHSISDNVDKFLNLAYSFDIGSKRPRFEYQEMEKRAKARVAQRATQRELSISNEIASETKERETHEKAVEKAASELERAHEALNKAQETLNKTQETHEKTIAEQDAAYTARILAQKERKIAEDKDRAEQNRLAAEENKKARAEAKLATEANKTQQSEAADTAGKEDNTDTQQA